MRVLVIGAGPSGLVAAKVLKEANPNYEVVVVESGSRIGGTYVNKTYEGSTLVSSTYLTAYSDFRRPDGPEHMTTDEYVAYLEDYAAEFQLLPLVRFHTCVQHIRKPTPPRRKKGGKKASSSTDKASRSSASSTYNDCQHHPEGGPYVVELTDAMTQQRLPDETFDAVAVCSGLHNSPRVPSFPNMAAFRGTMLHSAAYRGPFATELPNPPLGGAHPMVTTTVPATSAAAASSPSPSPSPSSSSSSSSSSLQSTTATESCAASSASHIKSHCSSNDVSPARAQAPASSSIFAGKRVLILGSGETAFDIGYAAAVYGASAITMTTRQGFVSVPASFPGTNLPPLDCLIMNLGTHGYESHWSAKVSFHWWITTKIQRLGLLAMGGSSYGLNQWCGFKQNMGWDRGNKHVVNKSSKCMSLLNRLPKAKAPYWQRVLNDWFYQGWDKAGDGIGPPKGVELLEGLEVLRMDDDGEAVHFAPISAGTLTTSSTATNTTTDFATDSETSATAAAATAAAATGSTRSVQADLIILATGYRQRFPFFDQSRHEREEEEHDGLPVGQRVLLQGLKARSDLNGSTGVIGDNGGAAREDGRFCVRLDSNGSEFLLKPQNLIPYAATTSKHDGENTPLSSSSSSSPSMTANAEDTTAATTMPTSNEDPLPSEHFIVDPHEPRLAYLGFVRPNVGAIPPMAEMQAMWWALRLKRLHDVSEEARASAKLSPSERRQKERLAFRAARRQRLRGGGGAWARDGTFLRHKTTAAEGDGSSSCSRSSSAATSSPLSSSSSAPPSEHNTSKGSGTGASRHQQHQHPGEGRPGALGPCRNLAEASWPMPGCARAKPYYKLSESKIAYGVDYGTYMFALAREMGSEPKLTHWLFKNPRVFAAAAFGQAHAPLFRLNGPFAHSNAPHICGHELLRPIWQRPFFMNVAFAGNALFFGAINVCVAAWSRLTRYTINDFCADAFDLYDEVSLRAGPLVLSAAQAGQRAWLKASILAAKLPLAAVFSPFTGATSSHYSSSYKSSGIAEVDWLAQWLVSQSRKSTESVTKLPESPTRDEGSAQSNDRDGKGSSNGSLASDLAALAALHAKGALTSEEFATAKAKLMAAQQPPASR